MSETPLPVVTDNMPAAASPVSPAAPAATPEVAVKEAQPLTEEGARKVLERVIDPELHMNIMELGLVYKVDVQDKSPDKPNIEVEMTLTSPGCPYGPVIMGQVPLVLKEAYGEQLGEVNVSLTFAPPWDPATMASEDVQFELGIF